MFPRNYNLIYMNVYNNLPDELKSNIFYYALKSPFDNNKALREQIINEACSSEHRFKRKMAYAKRQARARVKKRQLEKVKYYQDLKRKRMEKRNK